MCIPLTTNTCLIQVQPLKLAVSPHFEINISVPGNMIAPCEGNMSTEKHRDIVFDNSIKYYYYYYYYSLLNYT
jgi:hypothetical protein